MLKYSIVHVGNVVCVFLYAHEDILNKIQNEMKNIYMNIVALANIILIK
jgi:hypothetical protein